MDIRRAWLGLIGAAMVLLLWPAPARPAAPRAARAPGASPEAVNRVETLDIPRRIDVNNINMWVTNFGSFAWDLSTSNAGLIFPRGTNKTAVYASGLWLGCTVRDTVRTVVAEYSQEYGPGIMDSDSTFDNPRKRAYVVYKVLRWKGNPADTGHVELNSIEQSRDPFHDPLVHHSWSEYLKGAAPYGAPTRTYRLPNSATPAPGDSVDVLGPDVLGDQMMWSVYNDEDPDNHSNNAGHSPPLGVEIQQSTFAFNRTGSLGNTIFLKFKIKNKGQNLLENMFVSLWSDPDLGGASDDLVGCDTTLSLGYVYNATNSDQLYGINPPAVGYDFFQGPRVGATRLGLSSFNKYINGTDPQSRRETYNYMKGLLPDGRPVIDPTNGRVTHFFHPGDPVSRTGWLDSNPSDRRFMLSSGPFTMAPGDSQEVVGAIIVAQGSDRLSSITALKFFDIDAQKAFDLNFDLASPPSQPKVQVTTQGNQVTLCWDTAAEDLYSEPGYAFEGYNVYQGASVSGPWTRIATFDVINGVKTISDTVFDARSGQVVYYPVAFGADNGLGHCMFTNLDAINGGPLRVGTEYYFAVTAYAYGPGKTPHLLENPQEVIHVIPQNAPAGTDLGPPVAAVQYLQSDPSQRASTTEVQPELVTPSEITGHIYKVDFHPTVPLFFGQVGPDTATVKYSWSLTDSTTGTVLLNGQLNQRDDQDYRVVDGMRVRVVGSYFPELTRVRYVNNVADNPRALTAGISWSNNDNWFFGGAGYGRDFFSVVDSVGYPTSTLNPRTQPDSFYSVEIQFDRTTPQKAHRFLRLEVRGTGAAPAGGRRYLYGGYRDVPFKVVNSETGEQIEAAFVERCFTDAGGSILPDSLQPATFDSTWAPDIAPDSLGGREYVFALRRAYGDSIGVARDGALIANPATLPVLYALWAALRVDAPAIIDDGDAIDFTWAIPATSNDVYVFAPTPPVRNDVSLAKSRLDRVRVVPNPYYTRSRYETSPFNRVVRFINLPERCTIRIFNLAGDLVRTLEKTDMTSSILDWDLLTENHLPVGSGVYVFHVEAPNVGSTFGRMVVFMEKERLNSF
jgi:hypothetical protein